MNKTYNKLLNSNLKVRGVFMGLDFVSYVIDNLDVLVSSDTKTSKLSDLFIYDFRVDKKIKLKVNSENFQSNLNELYVSFVRDKILVNYSWFNEAKESLIKMLKSKFDYDSDIIISFFLRIIIDGFSIYSSGKNEYNYSKTLDFFEKAFSTKPLPKKEVKDFSQSILDCLASANLIEVKRKYYFGRKYFILTNRFMDSFFRLNSIFLVSFFDFENKNFFYDSQDEILKLNDSIEKFDSKMRDFAGLNELKNSLATKYPTIVDQIENYTLYDLDPDIMCSAPDHLLQALYGVFYYKTLLNEYCFHKVVSSCFYKYYENSDSKNILYKQKKPSIKYFFE